MIKLLVIAVNLKLLVVIVRCYTGLVSSIVVIAIILVVVNLIEGTVRMVSYTKSILL